MLRCAAGFNDPEYEDTMIFRNVGKYSASQRHIPKGWNLQMKIFFMKFYLLSPNNVHVDGTGSTRLYQVVPVAPDYTIWYRQHQTIPDGTGSTRLYHMVPVAPDYIIWYR